MCRPQNQKGFLSFVELLFVPEHRQHHKAPALLEIHTKEFHLALEDNVRFLLNYGPAYSASISSCVVSMNLEVS